MQPTPSIPLIALARGVDILARKKHVSVWMIRLVNCAASMVITLLEIKELISPQALLLCGGLSILIELAFHTVLQPRAGELHSLARKLLRRELYDAAGYTSAAGADTAVLRNKVSIAEPEAVTEGVAWLKRRVASGKDPDGKDFHSTLETEPKYRLLDSLYENFEWWESLAAWTARLYLIPLAIFGLGAVGVLFVVVVSETGSAKVSVNSIRIGLQIVVLFGALSILQDWHRWSGAATAFKQGRDLLQKRIVLHTAEEEQELHVIAADYAVLAASVPPVPQFIVDRAYEDADRQLMDNLRAREAERKKLLP